jgi:hypothetical protein
MKPTAIVVAAILALASLRQASASTVYDVHDVYNVSAVTPTTIDGTIITDGHLGILGSANILDWNLVINNLIALTPGNSDLSLKGNNLAATGLELFWNYDLPNGLLVFATPKIAGINGFVAYSPGAFVALAGFCSTDVSDCLGPIPANLRTGMSVIGIDPPTSVTPVPAALPLFATGLGLLGLLGWHRKRKTSAAVAP